MLASAPAPLWEVVQPFFWPLIIALAGTVLTTPIVRMIALRTQVLDRPDDKLKPHEKPVPYMGGVAIYIGWASGIVASWWLLPPERMTPESRHMLLHILAAGTLMMATGLLDDLFDLRPNTKLLIQLIAALALILAGIGHTVFPMFTVALSWRPAEWIAVPASAAITIFFVMGAANSTNLIDGLDGLCSGVTGIIAIGFAAIAAHLAAAGYSESGDPVRLVVAFSLLGACLGFLRYNFNPAQVFMGDAGSLLLGLNAAVLMLLFAEKGVLRWFLGACMVFALPVFDTALAISRRWLNGKPLFQGDRSHFYDQLRDRGYSVRKTVLICYVLTAGLAGIGCLVLLLRLRYSLIVFAAVVFAAVWAVWRMGMLRRESAGKG